jgi:hypothetical protein
MASENQRNATSQGLKYPRYSSTGKMEMRKGAWEWLLHAPKFPSAAIAFERCKAKPLHEWLSRLSLEEAEQVETFFGFETTSCKLQPWRDEFDEGGSALTSLSICER